MQRDPLRRPITQAGKLLEMLLQFFESGSHARRAHARRVGRFEFGVWTSPGAEQSLDFRVTATPETKNLPRRMPSLQTPNPKLQTRRVVIRTAPASRMSR